MRAAPLRLLLCAAACLAAAASARADAGGTGTCARVEASFAAPERLFLKADLSAASAYQSRGKIVENRPVEMALVRTGYDLGPYGQVGFWHFHVSSLSGKRQSVHRRAFNELDYGVFAHYDWAFNEDWRLSNDLLWDWITLGGYTSDYHDRKVDATIVETRFEQALENPYVTPFYLMRRGYHPNDWYYVRTGVRKTMPLGAGFSLVPSFFVENGNEWHFERRYGARAEGGHYHGGAQSTVFDLALVYRVAKHLALYASVRQFDILDADARESVKDMHAANARRDLTIASLGLKLAF